MSSKPKLTPRAREMYVMVEKYLKSGLSQQAFSKEAGIPCSTLRWWTGQYRKEKEQFSVKSNSSKGFIPLEVINSPQEPNLLKDCEIKYPNGVSLRLSGELNINLLASLIGLKEGR